MAIRDTHVVTWKRTLTGWQAEQQHVSYLSADRFVMEVVGEVEKLRRDKRWISESEARNVALGLGYVACAVVAERAGWTHHRCRDVGGKWDRWATVQRAMSSAGMWEERPFVGSDEDSE